MLIANPQPQAIRTTPRPSRSSNRVERCPVRPSSQQADGQEETICRAVPTALPSLLDRRSLEGPQMLPRSVSRTSWPQRHPQRSILLGLTSAVCVGAGLYAAYGAGAETNREQQTSMLVLAVFLGALGLFVAADTVLIFQGESRRHTERRLARRRTRSMV